NLGNLYVIADDRLIKVSPLDLATDVDDPVPPPPAFTHALEPNRPNPFNPLTVIDFTVPGDRGRGVRAKLEVLDIQGRLVRTLVEGVVGAGEGSATWDGRNDAGDPVASGTYFVKFEAGGVEKTRKITLVR
ncbi:MAG: T9SS type A sorting domain-containing protein, partial [Gemmatimonadetes bacterium]|nr:T9SS type A sorting domain-containing protein [Gemmatimonadota bacterium]